MKNDLKHVRLPTSYGEFSVTVHRDGEQRDHLGLRMVNLSGAPPLVRIHSECLTGHVFGSIRCDCCEQLIRALERIATEGRGLLLYLKQEGRGIGLANKLRAYALQDAGLDTVDAKLHLGFPADKRSFSIAASMLHELKATRIRLLTNNPQKIAGLEKGQIEIVERVAHRMSPRPENQRYLQTKAEKLGHLLGDPVTRLLA